jgi:hypothetical protein
MRSSASEDFWRCFDALPDAIQHKARRVYALWLDNPLHPGLHFKRVHPVEPVWSARIDLNYRALGLRDDTDGIVWFWIGSHDEYERIIGG